MKIGPQSSTLENSIEKRIGRQEINPERQYGGNPATG